MDDMLAHKKYLPWTLKAFAVSRYGNDISHISKTMHYWYWLVYACSIHQLNIQPYF